MAVITLKDGTVKTMFESKEAIEIIGQELYDFIINDSNASDLKEKIHELEVEIDDLTGEIAYLEDENCYLQSQIDDLEEQIVDHERE